MTKFNESVFSEEKCTNLGSNYRYILDTCYYFENSGKYYNDAKENCYGIFGSNTNGKLMEPTTMEMFEKIRDLAKTILGSTHILTGFEKHDDAGTDVRHNSDNSRALIKLWQSDGNTDDIDQPYLRFNAQSNYWQDGRNTQGSYYSICESY